MLIESNEIFLELECSVTDSLIMCGCCVL